MALITAYHNTTDAHEFWPLRLFSGLRRALARERARAELAQLDRREIRDIGLTTGEVAFLVDQPFWKD